MLGLAIGLGAWEDPFHDWKASGYLQAFSLMRPPGELAPSGFMDNFGRGSGGFNQDGMFVRKLEVKLSGPSGFEGWDLALGVQTDLKKVSLADAYAGRRWENAEFKVGNCRLPLGWENQLSPAQLPMVQRSLPLGLGNYGHTQDWGLGLLAERGLGLRLDAGGKLLGGLGWLMQSGGFYGKGTGLASAWMGMARAGASWGRAAYKLEGAFNGIYGYARLEAIPDSYAPLGLRQLQDPLLWEPGAVSSARQLLTWGPDLSLDLGRFHARAELLLQSLGGLTRGGGHATAWLELPSWELRRPAISFRVEQAWAGYGDGIHRPNSNYWGQSLGLSLPLWAGATLKAERQVIRNEDLGNRPVPGGEISLIQWQQEL